MAPDTAGSTGQDRVQGSAASMSIVDVYTRVPAIECKQRCQDSCRDVPLLTLERDELGLPEHMDVCPALGGLGLCTIHKRRPLMCRLWGVAENMPCPHGCQPTRRLTVAEASALVETAEAVGDGWVNL